MPPAPTSNQHRPPRVALLIESSRGYARGLLQGISQYIREQGPWSVFYQERRQGDPVPDWLREWSGDGIIARIEDRQMLKAVRATNVPAIDLRGRYSNLEFPLIETAEKQVCELAANHLAERGFKTFGYCGFVGTNYSMKRSKYFADYLKTQGFDCHVYKTNVTPPHGDTFEFEQHGLFFEPELSNWLRDLPKPIGLMTSNDIRGQQVLNACRELGIEVPDEIAVVGVDNDTIHCELSSPPLSSIVPDTGRIGYLAASMLDEMMTSGASRASEVVYVPPLRVEVRMSSDTLAVSDPDVAKALQIIRKNAQSVIAVPDIVDQVPICRSLLERKFKKQIGHSIKTEILRVRLQRVKELLRETELSVADIAEKMGFRHSEYLNVIFKQKEGVTPGKYRGLPNRINLL